MAKFTVTKVTVTRDTTVTNYLRYGDPYKKHMEELLKGVDDLKSWSLSTAGTRVTGAHPEVSGHPGHVDGKDWKINVERGNASQDRLKVKVTHITATPDAKDKNTINVEIIASVTVSEDTHKRDSRK